MKELSTKEALAIIKEMIAEEKDEDRLSALFFASMVVGSTDYRRYKVSAEFCADAEDIRRCEIVAPTFSDAYRMGARRLEVLNQGSRMTGHVDLVEIE